MLLVNIVRILGLFRCVHNSSTHITANPTGTVRPVKLVRPIIGFGSSAISDQTLCKRPRETSRPAPRVASLAIATSARCVGNEDSSVARVRDEEERVKALCSESFAVRRARAHRPKSKNKVTDVFLSSSETARISPPRRDPCFRRPHRD